MKAGVGSTSELTVEDEDETLEQEMLEWMARKYREQEKRKREKTQKGLQSAIIRQREVDRWKAEEIKQELAKKELKKELGRLQNFPIPRYQKFFLISMKGSFTNIHVDFSATSVYYHVNTGKKIFYVAPPTQSGALSKDRDE
uniref:JmjC domain-containing protein n=1 Tax=Caenorhabditis tropicalis TaxID=1561998 RepID=A0A1I7V3U8_9PELO